MNKKYWYRYYYIKCMIPGCDDMRFECKERIYTEKPTDKSKRHYIGYALCDGCLDSLTLVVLLEMGV